MGNVAGYWGGGAYSSTLNNCTVAGNSAGHGGGAHSSTLNNCLLTANKTDGWGGGANGGALNNCAVKGNTAGTGGGVAGGTLKNCTVTDNSAFEGGGVYFAVLNNCIIYYNNAAPGFAPNFRGEAPNNSCITPLPPDGVENISVPPLFVNRVGGNFRLQSNSPCINAGNNSYVVATADLDGRPRVVGDRVDIGAYEYQGAASGIFIGWLQQYGLPTDGSADITDPDGDHLNNYEEWRAETNPTNSASVLRLRQPMLRGSDLIVTGKAWRAGAILWSQARTEWCPPPSSPWR